MSALVAVAVLSFGVGVGVGAVLLTKWSVRPARTAEPRASVPEDWSHVVDLLRRAHGANLVVLVAAGYDTVSVHGEPRGPSAQRERAMAVARLAMSDERQHVLNERGQIVALGDGHHGIAVAFDEGADRSGTVPDIVTDLGRVLADLRSLRTRQSGDQGPAEGHPGWLVGGPDSLEGAAFQLCEGVWKVSGRPCALALRDAATQTAWVVTVSVGADRRLIGSAVDPESPCGRACMSEVPIVWLQGSGLFGRDRGDRRRIEGPGMAFPIWDGRECIGALAVFTLLQSADAQAAAEVQWMVRNASARLGRAAAVRVAETRALTDELTGLPNRRALERTMHNWSQSPCSLLCVDIDHFKKLNDGFGHPAGDAALRHLARVFRHSLRDGDMAARIGGEEFALWLPAASSHVAFEVADRVRRAVRESVFVCGGAELQLTCSVGVATVPDTVGHVDNLVAAADVALYQAKEAGRDRVEVARRGS